MAPGKRGKSTASTSRQTRSTKSKYHPIAHTQTLTQNPESSEDEESSTQNILGHPVPPHLLRNLSGDGQANHIKMNIRHPTFTGQSEKFQTFRHKLDNWLLINGVYNILHEIEPETGSNLALYLYISVCLDGEPFQLVSGAAKAMDKKHIISYVKNISEICMLGKPKH